MKTRHTCASVLLSAAVFAGTFGVAVQSASAGPNCTCRFEGGEVQEGQTACIKSPKGMTMARCELVLNNTSWKMLDQPCPFSEAVDLDPKDFAMLSEALAPMSDLAQALPN